MTKLDPSFLLLFQTLNYTKVLIKYFALYLDFGGEFGGRNDMSWLGNEKDVVLSNGYCVIKTHASWYIVDTIWGI